MAQDKQGFKYKKNYFNTNSNSKYNNLSPSGSNTKKNKKVKLPIKGEKFIKAIPGPVKSIAKVASIAKNINRISKLKNSKGAQGAKKVIIDTAIKTRKVISNTSNKVIKKTKEYLKNRADKKVIKNTKKAKVKADTVIKKAKDEKKLTRMQKDLGLRSKPFNRNKYDGKGWNKKVVKRNKVIVGALAIPLVIEGIKKITKGKTYKPDSGKQNYGTVNPATTGRKSEMISPYTNLKDTKKNPKITYNKPVAGKDFPDYNGSTGGNYSNQASGTQKDDEVYHKSQTQMNSARKSMGLGSYNFTGKKKK